MVDTQVAAANGDHYETIELALLLARFCSSDAYRYFRLWIGTNRAGQKTRHDDYT